MEFNKTYEKIFDVSPIKSNEELLKDVVEIGKVKRPRNLKAKLTAINPMYALSATLVMFMILAGGAALWLNNNADESVIAPVASDTVKADETDETKNTKSAATTGGEALSTTPAVMSEQTELNQIAQTQVTDVTIATKKTSAESKSAPPKPTNTTAKTPPPQNNHPVYNFPNNLAKISPNHPGNKSFPPFSSQLSEKICEAYAKFHNANPQRWGGNSVTADDLYVSSYLGTFNGNDVVSVWNYDYAFPMTKNIRIEGYLVGRDYEIMVYDGKTFVEIGQAYKQGLLKYQDIQTMAFMEIRISHSMRMSFGPVTNLDVIEDLMVLYYYKNSKSWEIATIASRTKPLRDLSKVIEVAGYSFALPSIDLDILVYSSSAICISEAYKQGLLSKNEIAEIHGKYFSGN